MSDTPRTDAAYAAIPKWTSHPARYLADFARELERENTRLHDALEYVRSLGEVYVYPQRFDCAGAGGLPTIDDYERVDLSNTGAGLAQEKLFHR